MLIAIITRHFATAKIVVAQAMSTQLHHGLHDWSHGTCNACHGWLTVE